MSLENESSSNLKINQLQVERTIQVVRIEYINRARPPTNQPTLEYQLKVGLRITL